MDADCQYQISQLVMKAAAAIRRAKGLPEERNITTLYNEGVAELGVPSFFFSGKDKVKDLTVRNLQFATPKKDCPKCGKTQGASLAALCMTCKDSEGGKYKTAWICDCGFKEVSEKFYTQWVRDVPTGTKEELGIKTLTDEGLK